MKGDDVGVLDLLQDADLPLDVLAAHAPPAGFRPPFLDEFGSILETGAFLTAFLHNCKLPAGEKMEESHRSFVYSFSRKQTRIGARMRHGVRGETTEL